MDRDEFMELVYETFADEPDNVLANGIIEAADAYAEHEKAQLSQEGTTSDLISRQAAIKALRKCQTYLYDARDPELKIELSSAEAAINNLPTVHPEPQEGHWIKHIDPFGGEQYECSECGVLWEFNDGTPEDNEAYFCLKCGADLRGKQNEL